MRRWRHEALKLAEASPTFAPPIQAALLQEASRLEITLAKGGLALSIGGLGLAAYTAAFIATPLGLALCAFALFLISWFSTVMYFCKREKFMHVFPWLCPLVEVTLPKLALALSPAPGARSFRLCT